jgi:hypothetical protein
MNPVTRITFSILFSILLSTAATAAPMVRVIDVRDCRTIVIDRSGVAAVVRLAQIVVPPDDEPAATDYLRNTLVSSWVLVETDARGESYVYRSPDGLFVNGEVARRAYALGQTKMVYLGEVDPGPQRAVTRTAPKAKSVSVQPPSKPQRARTSPRGAHRIPRTK